MQAPTRSRALALTMTTALLLVGALAPAGTADTPLGTEDGYTLMVHGHVEPDAPIQVAPPVEESLLATQDDGVIRLHVIPFSTATEAPVVVDTPRLVVTAVHNGDSGTFFPNASATTSSTCQAETSLPGHQGPLEACLVFEVPVEWFPGEGVVYLSLRFTEEDQWRSVPYSSVAHALLHLAIETGGEVTFEQADASDAVSTPFLVFEHADPA